MTIEQADKVDGIGIDRNKNELVMLISDHLSWNDEKSHMIYLENKIYAYINYIKSGQHFDFFLEVRKMPVRIKLIHEHSPTDSVIINLQKIATKLESLNIIFSHEPLLADY